MSILLPDRYRVLAFYEEAPDFPVTVRRDVTAMEAFMVFLAYAQAGEGTGGALRRLVITDTPDDQDMVVNFEWRHGLGIVFPDKETLRQLRYGKA